MPFVHALLGLLLLAGNSVVAQAAGAGDSVAIAEPAGAISGPAAEQRLRDELRVLLLDMVESGAFGTTPADQVSLSIDAPRQRMASLGVLVDSSSGAAASDGLHVLGTTPGSTAARIGLRPGDVLLSINGTGLVGLGDGDGGVARAALSLRDEVSGSADGEALQFEILRDGTRRPITGTLVSAWIPAMHLRLGDAATVAATGTANESIARQGEACGRISIFDVAPRQRQLHAATLISIDGSRSPFEGQTSFRVAVGRHVLTVAERIDARYLGFNDRLRNSDSGSRYKTITVDVAADTTYMLAARLNPDKRNVWRDGAYWDPVIWDQTAERCR